MWHECSLLERLDRAGLAPRKDSAAVTGSPLGQRGILIRQIEKLEHVGDEITHQIFQEVGTTFITPFDREDIQRLASVLDDIIDYIHGSAKRIELYKVHTIHPAMHKLAELITSSSVELNSAIGELRNMRKVGKIRELRSVT